MRFAPMTRTRRSCRPSARSRTVRPSISAANALSGVERRCVRRQRGCDPGGRDLASDDALARIGLKPIDARRLVRQALPDRQQQARDDVDRAVGEGGHLGKLGLPNGGEALAIGFRPVALRHHLQGKAVALHRANQPHASFDFAIIEHEARRRDLNGRTARALVDQQHGARIGEAIQSLVQRHRAIALALGDDEQAGLRAGAGMGVDRAPIGDDEALGAERLQPDVIGSLTRWRLRCGL